MRNVKYVAFVAAFLVGNADAELCKNDDKTKLSDQTFKQAAWARQINVQDFRKAFIENDYKKMDELVSAIVDSAQTNIPHYEDSLSFSYKSLANLAYIENPEENVIPKLNAWVEKSKTAASLSVRGKFYEELAASRRGYKYANETSKKQFFDMRAAGNLAIEDFKAAMKLDPKNSAVYESMISVGTMLSDKGVIELALSEAEKNIDDNYWVRHQYLMHLEPKWGGSFEEMDVYVDSIIKHAKKNPRIYSLRGNSEAYKGVNFLNRKDYKSAVIHLTNAINCGAKIYWLRSRAYAFYKLGSYEEAIADLNKVLELAPDKQRTGDLVNALLEMKAKPDRNWGEMAKSTFGI